MARSSAKRIVGTMLFFIALLLTLAFIFLLYANVNEDDVPLANEIPAARLVAAIALGVIALIIFAMLFTRRMESKAEVAEKAEVFFIPETPAPTPVVATVTGDVAVYDLRKVPGAKRAWGASEEGGKRLTYYFPRNVDGGVYVNDYVPIDNNHVLKLRTLMGGPESAAYALQATPVRSAARRPENRPTSKSVTAAVVAQGSNQGVVLQEVKPEPAPVVTQTYYDYPGDNHDVEDIEGIGPTYAARLRQAGVHTTGRLTYEEAGELANKLELPRRTVEQWKMMAELVKVKGIGPQYAEALVRAGVEGIAELKRRSPAKIAEQINNYLDGLEVNVLGNKITEKRVEGWQEAAKPMKRIRLNVPEK
jgi:predicted flap endonuclease-1-like 5' DNA nuclease